MHSSHSEIVSRWRWLAACHAPRRCAVRLTRHEISPRLAMRILSKSLPPPLPLLELLAARTPAVTLEAAAADPRGAALSKKQRMMSQPANTGRTGRPAEEPAVAHWLPPMCARKCASFFFPTLLESRDIRNKAGTRLARAINLLAQNAGLGLPTIDQRTSPSAVRDSIAGVTGTLFAASSQLLLSFVDLYL